ncbi:MAG TPA: hypothetical protein VFY19_10220 [Geminicoccaceae bacterium]|nr:hypothetical protein [Geminicoccaceae bacterium]
MSKRESPSPTRSSWPTIAHLILAAGTAIALISAPVSLEPGSLAVTWQAAHGKNDGGNGGGQGGGHGGGNGGGGGASERGEGGHGVGQGRGQGHGRGQDKEHQDLDQLVDDLRSGKAFGRERQDERIEQARQRYDRARGHAEPGGRGADQDAREVAHRFSAAETKELIERGWRAPAVADGFKNHGERVQTMVELAKRLGYGAKVGALQANFGTPYENDIARIEAELAQPDLDPSRRAELEAELDAAVAAAKPGNGANHDWARADLDVNDDGMVDQRDLETLDAAGDAGSDGGSGAPAAS